MVSGGEGNRRTFRKGRQVNFVDCAVEAEDGLEVGLDDIARQVLDDDDLRVGVQAFILVLGFGRIDVHAGRPGPGSAPAPRHGAAGRRYECHDVTQR